MSRKRRSPTDPRRLSVVFDYGGVLSAGHDPVPDLHALLGGDVSEMERALWEHRHAYDEGGTTRSEYWAAVAAAAGVGEIDDELVGDLQDADNRYFLHMDPASRELLHDLARNRMRMLLLSNASISFGQDVRRTDWFEAFGFAVISAEEKVTKPDPGIYRILLDALAHETGGVARPGDVIFFDDRAENVAAARDLGIDAHLWPRNGDTHPEGTETGAAMARRVLAGRGVPLD